MSSTYSTNLRTELIGTGDQAGNWGGTTNTSLGSILEQAIAGVSGGPYIGGTYPTVNFPTDADITLTANNGSVDQARSAVLVVTSSGSLTATRNVIAPASASKVYIIKNSTTGGQSIQIKYATGTGVIVSNGTTITVYGDGVNFNSSQTIVTNATNATNATTATTANALNSANSYSAQTFIANNGILQAGTTASGTYAFYRNDGGIQINGGASYPIARGDNGTYALNITGNAASATTATTAASANALGSETFNNTSSALRTYTLGSNGGGTGFYMVNTLNYLAAMYPVGSLYINTAGGTNPAILFGFGTWVAFGAGRVLIGDGGGFSAGATGGSADATLPSHTHTATSTVYDPTHAHAPSGTQFVQTGSPVEITGFASGAAFSEAGVGRSSGTANASTGITVGTTIDASGTGATNANLQPYVVVYMWTRTA